MKTFEQYLTENYTTTELQDIARHGCQGGVPGMIYYKETSALYDEYAEDLHDIVDIFISEQGYFPEFISKNIGSKSLFYNAMVWFCAEITAMNLTYEIEV
jgi:hypothetical protein